VGKSAGSEDADGYQELSICLGHHTQPFSEGGVRYRRSRLFLDDETD